MTLLWNGVRETAFLHSTPQVTCPIWPRWREDGHAMPRQSAADARGYPGRPPTLGQADMANATPIAPSDFKRIVTLGLSEATAHQLTKRTLRTQA
jgi:hypothetical protein